MCGNCYGRGLFVARGLYINIALRRGICQVDENAISLRADNETQSMTITITDETLRHAAEEGGGAGFLAAVTRAVRLSCDDALTASAMNMLNSAL